MWVVICVHIHKKNCSLKKRHFPLFKHVSIFIPLDMFNVIWVQFVHTHTYTLPALKNTHTHVLSLAVIAWKWCVQWQKSVGREKNNNCICSMSTIQKKKLQIRLFAFVKWTNIFSVSRWVSFLRVSVLKCVRKRGNTDMR